MKHAFVLGLRRVGAAFTGASLCLACSAESGGEGASDGLSDGSSVTADPADAPLDKAGNVTVQYCDVPNSSIGTRCVWNNRGTLCDAVHECQRDTRSVCGHETGQWVIATGMGVFQMYPFISSCKFE